MPMEWEKERIVVKDQGENQVSQILLEGDVIVPDSKPDVSNIMRTDGQVRIKNITVGNETANVSGELDLCILYTSDQGEKVLYGMTATLPMEEMLHIEGLEQGAQVQVVPRLEYLDGQVVNDRKIAVKAIIELRTNVTDTQAVDAIVPTDTDNFAYLEQTLYLNQVVAEKRDTFTIKEESILPSTHPNIGEILCSDVYLVEQDVRPMDGKVAMRGNMVLDVLYSDDSEDGVPRSYMEKLPFQWQMDVDGVTPQSMVDANLMLENMQVTPALDEDGEARIFRIDGNVVADVTAREQAERSVVTDIYSPGTRTEVTRETLYYPETEERTQSQFNLTERVTLEEGEAPMLQVEKVWGRLAVEDIVEGNGYLDVSGVLSVDILYFCADDNQAVCMVTKGIPFHQRVELEGVTEGDSLYVTGNIEALDFQSLSQTDGEVYATILLNISAERQKQAEVVTDVEEIQPIESGITGASIMIYRVQPGDSLWSIAKKFDTTIDRILRSNDIEDPTLLYPGQKLLIVHVQR